MGDQAYIYLGGAQNEREKIKKPMFEDLKKKESKLDERSIEFPCLQMFLISCLETGSVDRDRLMILLQ